jgi:hypothetical protein
MSSINRSQLRYVTLAGVADASAQPQDLAPRLQKFFPSAARF